MEMGEKSKLIDMRVDNWSRKCHGQWIKSTKATHSIGLGELTEDGLIVRDARIWHKKCVKCAPKRTRVVSLVWHPLLPASRSHGGCCRRRVHLLPSRAARHAKIRTNAHFSPNSPHGHFFNDTGPWHSEGNVETCEACQGYWTLE